MSTPAVSRENSPSSAVCLPIRVRATSTDVFAGLRGHAYIAARKLNKPITKVQTSAQLLAAPKLEQK